MKSKWLICSFFLFPALILLTIFIIYPSLLTVYYSLCNWDGLTNPKFIGLQNYVSLFSQKVFLAAIKNNIIWVIIFVPSVVFTGFFIAILLKNKVIIGRNIIKSLVFIGMAIPMVVAGILWMFIYDPTAGILNEFLKQIGLGNLARGWLGDSGTALYALIFANIWIWTGFSMILYSAGLENISEEINEQAKIDGCSSLQLFWYITFPMLLPITTVVIIMSLITSIKVFDIVYTTTQGGPGFATEVMAHLMYYEIFRYWRFGRGCAVAVIFTIIVIFLSTYNIMRMEKTE